MGVTLLSVLTLFTPGSRVPSGPWWADDVVHVTLFALLAGTGRMVPVSWPVLAFGLAGYAAFSEVVQAVAPLHRSGSVLDVLADLAGIGLGLLGPLGMRSAARRRRAARPVPR